MNKRVGQPDLRQGPDPIFDPVQKSLTEAHCKGQRHDAKHRDKNSNLTAFLVCGSITSVVAPT
jgi:hypothetical protein